MMEQDQIKSLMNYAKSFTGFTPEREALLSEVGIQIRPRLAEVTESFYRSLLQIPEAAAFLEGRIDSLKQTHLEWLLRIFTGPYDEEYASDMYRVGDAHVKVKLPVEFMAGAICLIQNELARLLGELYAGDTQRYTEVISAVNSVLGYTLMVMQQSYQSSTLAEELERFLAITGMSRNLFNNLADAYRH